MISRGLVTYSVLGHGLGPMLVVFDPTCGTDAPPSGGVFLVGGTVATPAGARMAIMGARTLTGATLPVTFASPLAAGVSAPPAAVRAGLGDDTPSTGDTEDLGDDFDCT